MDHKTLKKRLRSVKYKDLPQVIDTYNMMGIQMEILHTNHERTMIKVKDLDPEYIRVYDQKKCKRNRVVTGNPKYLKNTKRLSRL